MRCRCARRMRKTLRQQFAKVDNLASRSHLKENIAYQVICSSEPNNWPERSEAESKEPAIYLSLLLRDSSTSLGMTEPVHCLFRRSCLRISDTITPWIFSSRAGTRSG